MKSIIAKVILSSCLDLDLDLEILPSIKQQYQNNLALNMLFGTDGWTDIEIYSTALFSSLQGVRKILPFSVVKKLS